MQRVRVGLIGAGANTRSRHIPGLRAVDGVEIVAVCNRRSESTASAAREFNIPRTFDAWEDLVADPDIDAVVVGTWPYLHCPITLAALSARKHVLTEARIAMNAAEARRMLAASQKSPELVCQVVPSPFGLRAGTVVRELLDAGYVGEIRDVTVVGMNNILGGPDTPLHWRQDATLSGLNMLTLGIVHETVMRWTPPVVRVMAQVGAFVSHRLDPESGTHRPVTLPDTVQVLTLMANGAQAVYQFSGVTPAGGGMSVTLRGPEGMLHYDLAADRLFGAQRGQAPAEPTEIAVPSDKAGGWRVEHDFIDSIRARTPVRLTDFATGVAYMEFTESVARSARDGAAVTLPLDD
jgi:predicted dehydrogenase